MGNLPLLIHHHDDHLLHRHHDHLLHQHHHRQPRLLLFPTLFLLLSLLAPAVEAQSLWKLSSLVSHAESLLLRVANLRSERGDGAGAARLRSIAEGLRFLGRGGIWSLGWDYARNYAWRGSLTDFPTRDAWNLVSELRELGTMRSDKERVRWISRNYSKVLSLLRSVLRGLLRNFYRSGPLREMVTTLQTEVVEGNLLWDCMEVGGKDLDGLMTIARDYLFSSSQLESEDDERLESEDDEQLESEYDEL